MNPPKVARKNPRSSPQYHIFVITRPLNSTALLLAMFALAQASWAVHGEKRVADEAHPGVS
jgi:hypothetical protein